MDGKQENRAYVALNMVPNIGAVTARSISARFGSLSSVFSLSEEDFSQVPGIGDVKAEAIVRTLASGCWKEEIDRAAAAGVRLVTPASSDYPPLLRHIYDPPLVLYVLGDIRALHLATAAVVGTRTPSQYGRDCAKRFGFQLAQAGVTVVSGLARGIDTEAHRAALLARGRTVAIIGSAVDELYPPDNKDLAERIVAQGGAVVSEYPFGRKADRQTFPMRNRIVSGVSSAVLVIEGGPNSGTLITAEQAVQQNRPVLAVPGRTDNPLALGCHKLLKQGARLAECVEDVLEEMQTLRLDTRAVPAPAAPACPASVKRPRTPARPKQADLFAATESSSGAPAPAPGPAASPLSAAPALDDIELALLDALADGPASPDVLLGVTGLQAPEIMPKLISLTLKKKIKKLPGNFYELN